MRREQPLRQTKKKLYCYFCFSSKLKDKEITRHFVRCLQRTPSLSLFSFRCFEQMFSLKVWRILLYKQCMFVVPTALGFMLWAGALDICHNENVNMWMLVASLNFGVKFTQWYELLRFTWSWIIFPSHGRLLKTIFSMFAQFASTLIDPVHSMYIHADSDLQLQHNSKSLI